MGVRPGFALLNGVRAGTIFADASVVSVPGFDWKQCARHLWREVQDDQISNGAAALAFYMVLALFPSAIFSISVLPYLPIAHLDNAILDLVHQTLPATAADLMTNTVRAVVSQRSGGLVSFGLVFALWSAMSGMLVLMEQLNVVYEAREDRTFWRARARAFLLTIGFFGLVLGTLALVVFGGSLQSYIGDHFGWSGTLRLIFAGLRWLIIVAALHLAFSLIYFWGPNVTHPFALVTPGSVVGTVGLLVASIGFKIYVETFADYDALYGSLGAVIVLLLWLFVAGWIILFGAELNDVVSRRKAVPERSSGAEHDGGTPARRSNPDV
jgi:membrane protein